MTDTTSLRELDGKLRALAENPLLLGAERDMLNYCIREISAALAAAPSPASRARPEAQGEYGAEPEVLSLEWQAARFRENNPPDPPCTGNSSASKRPSPAFVVIQEGGSSGEHYIHSSDTAEAAEEFRRQCAGDSYRTSEVIEVPGELAQHGEALYELLEEVAGAELDYATRSPRDER